MFLLVELKKKNVRRMVQDELHVHDHIFLRIIIHVNFTITLFFQTETFHLSYLKD